MRRCDFRVSESAKKRKFGFRKRKRKVNEEEGRRDLGFGVGKRKGTSSPRKEDLRRRYVDDSDEERFGFEVEKRDHITDVPIVYSPESPLTTG
ncbi:unnamed protein product [Microthlaspi erraticum]|uniref:Uncharacterized protein n=1 Tax=Microthlaspi erraticum TaxID=1685480 RepID=A0A6D2ITX9_9BRAS|nr:unnamed protein product [Microthlaspi erraticum]